MFDSTTAPTKLGMQWKPSMLRDDNILYGKDLSGKQIVYEDYLVVKIIVVYTADSTANEEVIVTDEGFFYIQVVNPCIINSGAAVVP